MNTPNQTTQSPSLHYLQPDWPAPAHVKAFCSTRHHKGSSLTPFADFNLGLHVGDQKEHVIANRNQLKHDLSLPSEPIWLKQVHGIQVIKLEPGLNPSSVLETEAADAAYTLEPNQICAVLTADCLPILICDRAGTRVAAIHAGWRGLAGGIIQATLAKMGCYGVQLLVWLGPAIGPKAFEIGPEVREIFLAQGFSPTAFIEAGAEKWFADLYALAREQLLKCGVTEVFGGNHCTYTEVKDFFSYRKEGGITGRMASLIWLSEFGKSD
jgi:YfiH family protein